MDQEHETVACGHRVMGVVGDEDDRHTPARLADCSQDRRRLFDAEGGRGSSRISTLAPKYIARPIASDCRSPPDSVPTNCSPSDPRDAESTNLLERDAIGARGRRGAGNGGRPFSAPRQGRNCDQRSSVGSSDVLMDGGDATRARVARIGEAGLAAVEVHRPGGRRMEPGQNLDQRRFACAIVAEQADDSPGAQRIDTSVSARPPAKRLRHCAVRMRARYAASHLPGRSCASRREIAVGEHGQRRSPPRKR